MTNEQIKTLFAAYCGHTKRKPSTVGNYAVNDGKFFERIEGGRTCTISTAQKLLGWLSDHWPADLEWPRGIPRPIRSKEAA